MEEKEEGLPTNSTHSEANWSTGYLNLWTTATTTILIAQLNIQLSSRYVEHNTVQHSTAWYLDSGARGITSYGRFFCIIQYHERHGITLAYHYLSAGLAFWLTGMYLSLSFLRKEIKRGHVLYLSIYLLCSPPDALFPRNPPKLILDWVPATVICATNILRIRNCLHVTVREGKG